jgi:hypothetical protein
MHSFNLVVLRIVSAPSSCASMNSWKTLDDACCRRVGKHEYVYDSLSFNNLDFSLMISTDLPE